MRIGIDIDGVIFNTENEIRVKAELYDLLELKGKGIVNPNGFIEQERYEWTQEELDIFRSTHMIQASREAFLMPGAKQIIQKLQEEGNEFVVITARGRSVKEMKQEAMNKFQENQLEFDQYYWAQEDKLEVCQKENVDIMIDDKASVCKQLAENKIKTLYFRDVNREKLKETKYLKEVNNWGEIYRYIYNITKGGRKIAR